MGNVPPNLANFEQVQGTVISVLGADEQDVLISGTVPCADEIREVERALALRTRIVIYGRNDHDARIYAKYEQIRQLGGDPRLYLGGLFEWLLLQDFYGAEQFPTTAKADLLKYKPPPNKK